MKARQSMGGRVAFADGLDPRALEWAIEHSSSSTPEAAPGPSPVKPSHFHRAYSEPRESIEFPSAAPPAHGGPNGAPTSWIRRMYSQRLQTRQVAGELDERAQTAAVSHVPPIGYLGSPAGYGEIAAGVQERRWSDGGSSVRSDEDDLHESKQPFQVHYEPRYQPAERGDEEEADEAGPSNGRPWRESDPFEQAQVPEGYSSQRPKDRWKFTSSQAKFPLRDSSTVTPSSECSTPQSERDSPRGTPQSRPARSSPNQVTPPNARLSPLGKEAEPSLQAEDELDGEVIYWSEADASSQAPSSRRQSEVQSRRVSGTQDWHSLRENQRVLLPAEEAEPSAPPITHAPVVPPMPMANPPMNIAGVGSISPTMQPKSSGSPLHTVDDRPRMESTIGNLHEPAPAAPSLAPVLVAGPEAWQAMVAYDAVVRLCLAASARGCLEAHQFLHEGCLLLRQSFGLEQALLQPNHGAVARRRAQEEAAGAPRAKNDLGVVRVQVLKARLGEKQTLAQRTGGVVNAAAREGGRYLRQASERMRERMANRLNKQPGSEGTLETPPHTPTDKKQRSAPEVGTPDRDTEQSFPPSPSSAMSTASSAGLWCTLRLRSAPPEKAIRANPGGGDTFKLQPESETDEVVLEVMDARGMLKGRLSVALAGIEDEQRENRPRWIPFYHPEHDTDCIGRIKVHIVRSLEGQGLTSAKWQAVNETMAYDALLAVALRAVGFARRHLAIQGSWKWLLGEFALHYSVNDAYCRLRYLVHIMEQATPTKDCLELVYEMLAPVWHAQSGDSFSRQERRLLQDVEEAAKRLLAVTFENYRSLDEGTPSGVQDTPVLPPSGPPALRIGSAAPAVAPAVQLYCLLHDILSPTVQEALRSHFQVAARRRCRRHLESDADVAVEGTGDYETNFVVAYARMKALCLELSSEVQTDIEIHRQNILPTCIDLPQISAEIYNEELGRRLRAFLKACPPGSPSGPVLELLHATADFQRDLHDWGLHINPQAGVDALDLFGLYIEVWIQDTRLRLLDSCKADRARWVSPNAGPPDKNAVSPFVEEMYQKIRETLQAYESVISRWPEYAATLEMALCDVERGVIAALDRHYAEWLLPFRDGPSPKVQKYVAKLQALRRRNTTQYIVPHQLGIVLNSVKRLLEILRPRVETQMRAWVASWPGDRGGGQPVFGERFGEVTVELRAKYKNTLWAIIEKLKENAHLERKTHLKKILQDTKPKGEDLAKRMQPLVQLLRETISSVDAVLGNRVSVAVCRGFWDQMARDVLHFLENRKENMSWVKSSSAGMALEILDRVFTQQMQQLQGHALQEKDLEPPRSVQEARSMLAKDLPNGLDQSYSLF